LLVAHEAIDRDIIGLSNRSFCMIVHPTVAARVVIVPSAGGHPCGGNMVASQTELEAST